MEVDDVLLVIIGAGASFDCMPGVYSDRRPSALGLPDHPFAFVRPPLTKALTMEQPFYNTLVSKYPACRPVVDYLRRELLSPSGEPATTLEEALGRYEQSPDPDVKRHIMATRFYLRDLLWGSTAYMQSSALTGGVTNYTGLVRLLRHATAGTNTHLCFVSFNFDLLLEDACRSHWGFDPFDMASYLHPQDVSILKPHGSVQWCWPTDLKFNGGRDYANQQTIQQASQLTIDTTAFEIEKVMPFDPAYQGTYGPCTVPALALPIANKDSFAWPDEHATRIQGFKGKINRLMTIGWRAAEPHFRTLLESVMMPGFKLLVVAGSEPDADEVVTNLGSVAAMSPHRRLVSSGFSGLLTSQDLGWLLSDDDSPWLH